MMQLPPSIDDLFTQQYEGFRAAKLRAATDAVAVENELRRQGRSYRTLIARSKKHGRTFMVLLCEPEAA